MCLDPSCIEKSSPMKKKIMGYSQPMKKILVNTYELGTQGAGAESYWKMNFSTQIFLISVLSQFRVPLYISRLTWKIFEGWCHTHLAIPLTFSSPFGHWKKCFFTVILAPVSLLLRTVESPFLHDLCQKRLFDSLSCTKSQLVQTTLHHLKKHPFW